MNTNEQWQECQLEEATHIKTTTGQIYELDDDDGQVIIPGGGWVEISDFLEAPAPVRKAEVRPVEFVGEVGGVNFDGSYAEVTVRVLGNVGGNLGEDLLGRNVKVEVQP